jgi:hypothetical protein
MPANKRRPKQTTKRLGKTRMRKKQNYIQRGMSGWSMPLDSFENR